LEDEDELDLEVFLVVMSARLDPAESVSASATDGTNERIGSRRRMTGRKDGRGGYFAMAGCARNGKPGEPGGWGQRGGSGETGGLVGEELGLAEWLSTDGEETRARTARIILRPPPIW